MSEKFQNLIKIPEQPAARLLAIGTTKIEMKLKAPVSATVAVVLGELEKAEAYVDMIRLLSVSLPSRECVWWACIAGKDIMAREGYTSECLLAAEAWVFKPTNENRKRLHLVLENESGNDPAVLAATAAFYAPGTMGLGDMEEQPAPSGIVASCTFGINLLTIKLGPDPDTRFKLIIDRALDIARGGSGNLSLSQLPTSSVNLESGII